MLKHAVTLGMFIIAGLMFAVASSASTTLIGFAMVGVAISTEVSAWNRVMRTRRGHAGPASRWRPGCARSGSQTPMRLTPA